MLARISSSELTEWMIIYSQNPWGGWRGDLQAGIIASTFVNVMAGKGARKATPADFMCDFEPKKPKSVEEMRRTMDAFAAVQNQRRKPRKNN